MINPNIKIAKSRGIDLPILYVYLAGRIAGNCMEQCIAWRKQIRGHYKNYEYNEETKEFVSFPIAFFDPLNSGESKTADKLGLTSHIPSNLIYHKDLLSVERADVIVANVEDYFEVGIEDLINTTEMIEDGGVFGSYIAFKENTIDYKKAFYRLQDKIKNRRENFGTICEISWALYLNKPLILLAPENRKEIYEKHPFSKRASVIVSSVNELLQGKYLETIYKAIAGAIY